MARVTVEDCIEKVRNRFDLVMVASQRSRNIANGEPLTIERDGDKDAVVALREIAQETVSPEDLREDLIVARQKFVERKEPEDVSSGVQIGHGEAAPADIPKNLMEKPKFEDAEVTDLED